MWESVFATIAPEHYMNGANVLSIVPGTKRPTAGVFWKPWQDRRQTLDELAHLVAAHGTADVAIITGAVSKIVVLDIDGADGEAALRESRLPLPRTAMYTTRRGINRVYRTSISLPSRLGFRPHLDILANRHYAGHASERPLRVAHAQWPGRGRAAAAGVGRHDQGQGHPAAQVNRGHRHPADRPRVRQGRARRRRGGSSQHYFGGVCRSLDHPASPRE